MIITVKIFVGGTWVLLPHLHYVEPEEIVFQIEHDRLTINDIHERVVNAGYLNVYHYDAKYPWQEMEVGIRGLRKDKHVKRMVADMLRDGEDTMEVYVEHFIHTPPNVVILDSGSDEEMEDEEDEYGTIIVVELESVDDIPNATDGGEDILNAAVGGDEQQNEGYGGEEVMVESCNDDIDSDDCVRVGATGATGVECEDGIEVEGVEELNHENGPEGTNDGPEIRPNSEEDGPEVDSGEEDSRDSYAERTYPWERVDDGSSDEGLSDFVDSEDDEDDDLFDIEVEDVDFNVEGEHVGVEEPRSDRVNRPPVGRTRPGVPDVETDYEDSDNLDTPPCSDSEEEADRLRRKYPDFNEDRDFDGEIKLEVGMRFANANVFRKALSLYSIQIGHDYRFVKNESIRVTAICKNECGWRIHASPSADRSSFQIKTFKRLHYCGKDLEHRRATARWLAETYLADFRDQPDMDLEVLPNRVRREKFVKVSYSRLVRARVIARELIEGEHGEQYKLLWRYAEAVRNSNPGSTVKMTAPDGVFQRMYICLDACKRGFLRSCRPFIGIDGCHLKGKFKGHLLSAVGKDANGNIFPIAWAVVDSECRDNWLWFLERLKDDIGSLEERCFMSDRQKGLQNIFDTVLKDVDHRYCVRHIWNNFKGEFGGSKYMKDLLWAAARAYTATNFDIQMEKVKCENPAAYAWLKRIPPQRWSRHAFNNWVMCDLLLNNLSESFNSYVRLARKKPILTCLEVIRRLLMKRFYIKYQGMLLYEGTICPRWFNRLEKWIQDCQSYIVYPHSQSQKFEVEHITGEKSICDLQEKTCSCKRWDMTGIPCKHASATYMFMGKNPHNYVHVVYNKTTFLESYKDGILPVPDQSEWPVVEGCYEVRPPERMAQSGRPRLKRRREAGEAGPPNPARLRRDGLVMTCRNCRGKGHNTRTCPQPMRADIPPLRRKNNQAPASAPAPVPAETEAAIPAEVQVPAEAEAEVQVPAEAEAAIPAVPEDANTPSLRRACRNCRGKGHNTRTCPQPVRVDIPPLRRRKKQTPASTPSTSAGESATPTLITEEAVPQSNNEDAEMPAQCAPEMPTPRAPEMPTPRAPEMPTPCAPEMPTPCAPEMPTPTPSEMPTPDVQPIPASTRSAMGTTTSKPKKKKIWRPTGSSGSFLPPRPTTRSTIITDGPGENPKSRNHIPTRKWIP